MKLWRGFAGGMAALALAAAAPVCAQAGLKAADAKPKAKSADPDVPTAIGGSGGLVVSGIDVDVGGKSPSDARMNGWREAQRLAWPALWARMSGQAAATAPRRRNSAGVRMPAATSHRAASGPIFGRSASFSGVFFMVGRSAGGRVRGISGSLHR